MLTFQKYVHFMRTQFPPGSRVLLLSNDQPKPVPDGTMGTLTEIDSAGRFLVNWDTGKRTVLQENLLSEEQERGLMHWYGKSDALSWKVKSAFFDVELHDGQLWGVADCQLLESLEGDELGRLTTYLAGQASDGWGEGFEQQEIPVGRGLLYVHLWDGQDWEMAATEPEQREKGEMRFGQSL